MKVVHVLLLVLCLGVAITLTAAVAHEIYASIGPYAMGSKSVVELWLAAAVAIIFFKWSRDLWRRLRRQA